MKILIDGRTITDNPSGVGYVVISLLKELSKEKDFEFVVLTRKGLPSIPGLPNVQTYEMNQDYQFVGFNRFEFEQVQLPKIIRTVNPDIVHLTDSFGLPILRDRSIKYLLTLHDLIPMTQYRELMTKIGGIFYDISIRVSVNGADEIVCISDFTKRDLHRFFPSLKTKKVEVIYNGVDFVDNKPAEQEVKMILEKFKIKRPYFFYVGGFPPRKNTINLIKAFVDFNEKNGNTFQLVLAGRMSQKPDIIKIIDNMNAYINENNLDQHVKLLGYITIDEKTALLAGALSLTYLSYYEGFGLPVIEAFSVGTPVITSSRSAMQEVAGENALYADPSNIEMMSNALAIMARERDEYVKKAENSLTLLKKRYNWPKTAKQYAELYRRLHAK